MGPEKIYHLASILFIAVIQRAFPRIAFIEYQTIAFILSFFRNVVSESNQIDSLKNVQDDPFIGNDCVRFLYISYN